ncbi:MAG: PAS domain S-box protein, partial [Anaerolineae bacterium]|nr:PAS domain S-box protein [Anaerolineae bacterium]
GETLVGAFGFVLDLGRAMAVHVAPVRSGQYGAAWALGDDGQVLYDHESEIIGQNVHELHLAYPDVQNIDQRILAEETGQGEYHFTVERGGTVSRKLVAWDTAYLGDYPIHVALSAPDSEINAAIDLFRQQATLSGGMLGLALIGIGAVVFLSRQRVLEQRVGQRTLALEQAEARYRALFENARDAIIVTDDAANLIAVNHQAEQLSGYTRDELLTMTLVDLTTSASPDSGAYAELKRAGSHLGEYRVRRKDGREVDVEVAATAVAPGRYQSIMRDVTARNQTEQSLRRYNQAMLALSQAAIVITSELDRDEVIQRLVETAERIIPSALLVTVQLRDVVSDTMETSFASPHARRSARKVIFRPGVGIAGHAIAERRVINVPDVTVDPRFVPGEHPPSFRSLLVAPLVTSQDVWGTVSVEGANAGAFSEEDELLLNLLARQSAVAVENAALYRSEQQQREIAETLRDIGLVLTGALRQEDVLERILTQVARVVPYDAAGVWLVNEDGGYQMLAGIGYEQYGLTDNVRGLVWMPDDDSVMTTVGGHFQSLTIPDVRSYPGWVVVEGYEWLRSWAGVPIIVRGLLLGVLCLDHTRPGFYGPEHIPILEALATQVSLAIENAQLFEQVQAYAIDLEAQVEQRTAEVRLAQERMAAILRNIDDGVITTTPTGRITYVNPGFERMVGWVEGDVLNKSVASIVHRDTPRERLRGLVQAVREHRAWRDTLSLRHREWYAVEVEAAGAPFRDEAGAVEGYIVSLRNLRAEQVLERMKARFITLISHELRTPLTNLKLYVHLIRRTLDDPVRRQAHLNSLAYQTDRLALIMEKVLTFTRLADARALEAPRLVHFSSLLDSLRVRFATIAAARRIALEMLPAADDIPPVYGDEYWLTQACFELIENALTYTPAGGRVQMGVTALTRHGVPCVALRVQDTGPGISPEDIARLNDSFVRVGMQEEGMSSGLGLGLFIVRSVAEQHGG